MFGGSAVAWAGPWVRMENSTDDFTDSVRLKRLKVGISHVAELQDGHWHGTFWQATATQFGPQFEAARLLHRQ